MGGERRLPEARNPTPVAPLHLRLFNCLYHLHYIYHLHVQNGYAYTSPPKPLVYANRPLLGQFEDPKAVETTHKEGAGSSITDSAHGISAHPRILL